MAEPIDKLEQLRQVLDMAREQVATFLSGPAGDEQDALEELAAGIGEGCQAAEEHLGQLDEVLDGDGSAIVSGIEELEDVAGNLLDALPAIREGFQDAESGCGRLEGHAGWIGTSASAAANEGFAPLGSALDAAQDKAGAAGDRVEAAVREFEARLQELSAEFTRATRALGAVMSGIDDEAEAKRTEIERAAGDAVGSLDGDAAEAGGRCAPVREAAEAAYENAVATVEADGEEAVDAVRAVLDAAAEEVRTGIAEAVAEGLNELVAGNLSGYLAELDRARSALRTAAASEQDLYALTDDMFTAKRSVDVIDELLQALRTG